MAPEVDSRKKPAIRASARSGNTGIFLWMQRKARTSSELLPAPSHLYFATHSLTGLTNASSSQEERTRELADDLPERKARGNAYFLLCHWYRLPYTLVYKRRTNQWLSYVLLI